MKTIEKSDICIIGPGRLGMTLAYCFSLSKSDTVNLVAVSGRRTESIDKAKALLGKTSSRTVFLADNAEAARNANCIMICTPDDTIKTICEEIFEKKQVSGEGKTVVHFSGLKDLDVLEKAKASGASVCCIHPMKSFANYLDSANTIKGTLFGVTFDKKDKTAVFTVKNIVDFLQGKSVYVENSFKAVYHACACIASNYLVGLLSIVEKMGKEIGIKPEIFMEGILNLSQGTIDNIKKFGTGNSLTGPIARGDTGTIKTHIEKIESRMSKSYSDIYKLLGRFTADIALENKWIDGDKYNELMELFVF